MSYLKCSHRLYDLVFIANLKESNITNLDCRYGSLKTGDCQNMVSGSLKVQIKAVWIRGECC